MPRLPSTDTADSREDGEPPAKRSRVSRACDQCRSGREKCDGDRPRCATCALHGRPCTYHELPKKRGIQPNYIRTLELTLTWLLQTRPDVESVLVTQLPQRESPLHRLVAGKDPTTSEELHRLWNASLANRQIDQLLSGQSIDIDGRRIAEGVSQPTPEVPIPHSQAGSSLLSNEPLTSHNAQLTPRASPLQPSYVDFAPIISPSPTLVSTQRAEQMEKLPDNALHLLEYYFAFTHSWLPLIEKSTTLKLIYSYPRNGLRHNQMHGPGYVELWSIMAVASTQIPNESNPEEVDRIVRIAESLLPTGDAEYEVAHLNALMLLTLLDIQRDHAISAWLRIGTAVRLLEVAIHLDPLSKTSPHLYLAAFVLEHALALQLKVRPHSSARIVDRVGFVAEDGLDEWAPWHDPLSTTSRHVASAHPTRAFSTLNNLVRIYMGRAEDEQLHSGESEKIVFSLVENAAKTTDRMPPSILVQNAASSSSHHHGLAGNHNRLGSALDGTDPFHPRHLDGQLDTFSEANTTALTTSPLFSVHVGSTPSMADIAHPQTPSRSLQSAHLMMDGLDDGTNVFEEFDAMLERHDTNNQPRFMQNLGFGPNVDLAELFGADYTASDPLLAYAEKGAFSAHIGS